MNRRRLLARGATLIPLSLAGCLDSIESLSDGRSRSQNTTTTRDTVTSETTSNQAVSLVELPPFPEGPKERPSPPNVWNESSAKSYAKEYEERRLYNEYYGEDAEKIRMGCTHPDVERTEEGYKVYLRCQGAIYEESSTTHRDYMGAEVVYYLTSKSVSREINGS